MLRIKDITKDYKVADSTVRALKGVSLSFRKSEFVSILGPSGCGKTTLLNIIGGLDRYTDGDVFIGGISTKDFSDADWDVYRNHRVGFIFQSYNLIPHQTVLGNVELALTIAGMSKAERVEKAKKALDRVGLAGQYDKRPNQLSGGQCQRVAIARALVNEPEILLADEPTGALDSTTSVQIMDLIKEIATEKLVIMVTHNPELAEQYSTRIIRLRDGEVEGDTDPYDEKDEIADTEADRRQAEEKESVLLASLDKKQAKRAKKKAKQKAKMSPFTAFRLSAQNLFSKRARTIMTSIAGSIGIIGVSMVLALSAGVQGYITTMQNDMLSGNPITISQQAFDMTALMQSTSLGDKTDSIVIEDGYVNVNSMIENLIAKSKTAENLVINNTITQDYVDYVKALPSSSTAAVFLDYGLDVGNNIYTNFTGGDQVTRSMSLTSIRSTYISILKKTNFAKYATYVTSIVDNFQQCPADEAYILQQYDLVGEGSRVAKEKNEIMIVISEKSELTDILLAQLGYYTQDEFTNLIYRGAKENDATMDRLYDSSLDKDRFSYEELLGKRFVYYGNDTVYNVGTDNVTYNHIEDDSFSGGMELEIVGILMPKSGTNYGCMEAGFFYTESFADAFINGYSDDEITLPANKDSELIHYMESKNADSLTSYFSNGMLLQSGVTYRYDYYYYNDDFTEKIWYNNNVGVVGSTSQLSSLTGLLGSAMGGGSSSSTELYTLSRQNAGGNTVASSISVYPVSFETKADVKAYLNAWNEKGDIVIGNKTLTYDDRESVTPSDNLETVMNMINELVNIITIALVGFTALSLVVSSVMIGIITYVSVVERTKEIGVIRSLGGRKKDVSRLFTAETAIIGLTSGLFGVGVTYLLSLVINAIVGSISVISSIAALPAVQAVLMVVISVALTLISGVFPARAAARKDPVVALRTE